jgi:F-type H+-transporting ATPase subunit epsilon
MSIFTLHLQSGIKYEEIADVISFTATDKSGSFGLEANHARMMTCLIYGLAKFQTKNDKVEYLAMPGAVIYFKDNHLYVNTSRYLRGNNYEVISEQLNNELANEEKISKNVKETLKHLDENLLRRLWQMKKKQQI